MSLKSALYSHLVGAYGTAFTANATTDVITATGHGRIANDKVRVGSTGTLPEGLSANTDYFVRDVSGATFKLAATSGGSAIDITDTGTGTHSLGTGVTDLVANRIYPDHAPQGVSMPYIVYQRISSVRYPHMGGPSGLVTDRIQFDIFASTALSAESVRDAVRLWLDGHNRSMGTELLDVRYCELAQIVDGIETPIHGQELGTHRVTMDFLITFAETIPAH